jgi:hypothetical protein
MDIPDESPWGPVPDTVRVEFVDSGEITPELTVGLLADIKQVQRERDAAIARAAQVAILRELANEWAADEICTSSDTVERETWWMAVVALRDKADALEQT